MKKKAARKANRVLPARPGGIRWVQIGEDKFRPHTTDLRDFYDRLDDGAAIGDLEREEILRLLLHLWVSQLPKAKNFGANQAARIANILREDYTYRGKRFPAKVASLLASRYQNFMGHETHPDNVERLARELRKSGEPPALGDKKLVEDVAARIPDVKKRM